MSDSRKTQREKTVRRIVSYAGRVQGVGFRYTACRVAEGYAVTGYVKNLPDRRVEVLAEGDEKEVDAFLKALQREMGQYIREVAAQEGFATGQYSDFHVEYY
jgi:acylphosphatase